jgi:hypothetical protein
MSVYALHDPRTGVCRYVGRSRRGIAKRVNEHMRRSHSKPIRAWVAELSAIGLSPIVKELTDATEYEWIGRLSPDLNVHRGANDRDDLLTSAEVRCFRSRRTTSIGVKQIAIRFSAEQRDALIADSKKLKVSVGEVIRRRCFPEGEDK